MGAGVGAGVGVEGAAEGVGAAAAGAGVEGAAAGASGAGAPRIWGNWVRRRKSAGDDETRKILRWTNRQQAHPQLRA